MLHSGGLSLYDPHIAKYEISAIHAEFRSKPLRRSLGELGSTWIAELLFLVQSPLLCCFWGKVHGQKAATGDPGINFPIRFETTKFETKHSMDLAFGFPNAETKLRDEVAGMPTKTIPGFRVSHLGHLNRIIHRSK